MLSDGPQMFGRPCRVTAVVYPGVEGPVNIAREVEMSGPMHSKGVLVLAGFLAARFGQQKPPLFGASLVFEQTYEAIDGDSASSSELYALLSALSGCPLRQELAVTGSVDQQGGIQPVGGLNEKIEAFYDLCAAKGLNGRQGVLIPERNRDALMLRGDVVDAIARGAIPRPRHQHRGGGHRAAHRRAGGRRRRRAVTTRTARSSAPWRRG